MQTFNYKEYEFNIYTDIMEWANEFYDVPEGAELANRADVEVDCAGFCDIDDKEISIFVPRYYDKHELQLTVAHEIGHCIEYTPIPTEPSLHEPRAMFFENFFSDVLFVTDKIIDML